MILFGDTHGDFDRYLNDISVLGCDESIQVGDFGMGFVEAPAALIGTKHLFIRGNHDDPELCKASPQYIPDGQYFADSGMMCIGGAYSVDRDRRVEGRDWWRDEELSQSELYDMYYRYVENEPSIIITHTCPSSVIGLVRGNKDNSSRTDQALQSMLEVHAPKLWVFGHFHARFDKVINGTRYVCIDKNCFVDIDLDAYAR